MTTNFPTSLDTAASLRPAGATVQSDSQTLMNALAAIVALETRAGAGGYKIARGVHRQVAAADTVATGLATCLAVVASFEDTPTVKQLFCYATIGDQVAAPVAGSIIISTKKPTAVNDVTPIASTDWSDNIDINWIAIGT